MNSADDDRIAAILGEWYAGQESDDPLDAEDFVAANPELADELRLHFRIAAAAERSLALGARAMPERIGDFRLIRELGTGGMGTVYLAEADGSAHGVEAGDRVALKVVHPHLLARAGSFKRFLREAEAGRRVRHQHVVSTFDADARDVDGTTHLFLVMEYVEGRTLRRLLDDLGVVPEALVREIATQLAEGLAGIHAEGIVHRDLKPENVIITSDHRVRIMDLGIALMDDDLRELTGHGRFTGSLHYAAPEQLDSSEVGPAADLYSLGVLLYELATGTNPFRRDDAGATIRAQLEEAPQRVDERDPELSGFLSEVLATLLEKAPAKRFASADELRAALTSGRRSSWWTDREQATLRARARVPTVPVRRETPLRGREGQLALLHTAWERSRSSEGQVVLLEGEAGIGKSRLVDAFLRELPGGDAHVLYGSYPPTTGSGALTAAIREHLGEAALTDALRPRLTATPSLVEPFAALLSHQPPPAASPSLTGDALHAVFCHLMRALADEKPLIWIVEDLHFASADSRAVVLALARAVAGRSVLLVATTRPELPDDLLVHLRRIDAFQRAPIERLGGREIILLLEDALHSRMLAERLGGRIALASDGVPFFVLEMIRGLREGQFITQRQDGTWIETKAVDRIEVPPAVRGIVEARLRRLTKEERALVDAGAVEGYEFDPDLIACVTSRPRLAVLQDLAELERSLGVVRALGSRYRFDHHQVHEVVYGDLSDGLRREYHTLLAEAFAERYDFEAARPRSVTGEIALAAATHHLRGRSPEGAIPFLLPALDLLAATCRGDDELDLMDRALALGGALDDETRYEVLIRKADRLDHLARTDEQTSVLRDALLAAERVDDRTQVGRVLRLMAFNRFHLAQYDEALALLVRARDQARTVGNEIGEAVVVAGIGVTKLRQGDLDGADTDVRWALRRLRQLGHRQRELFAVGNLASICEQRGLLDEAVEWDEASVALARELGDRRAEARALGNMGNRLQTMGRFGEARERQESARELAREIGFVRAESRAIAGLGVIHFFMGRFEEARACHLRRLQLTERIGDRRGVGTAQSNLSDVCAALGWYGEAVDRANRAHAIALDLGERGREANFRHNLGTLMSALGDATAAREHFEAARAISRERGMRYMDVHSAAALGELAERDGDDAAALHSYEEAVAKGGETGQRREQAFALMRLGALHARSGRYVVARPLLDEALTLARASAVPATATLAACHLAQLPEADVSLARAAFNENETVLGVRDRVEANFLLWSADQSSANLAEAHRLLLLLREHAPDDCHDPLFETVPLHRDVAAAWDARGEAHAETGGHSRPM